MRICMWSGPRNLSTAMMYSFGARADCAVMDEPFYAAWLAETGWDHPMRAETLAAHETDPAKCGAKCAIEPTQGHVYQKHMPHHMLQSFDLDFMRGAAHVFLIRHPARVAASYAAKTETPKIEEVAPPQMLALWEEARALGPVPVIDSADIRRDPRTALTALCDAIGIPFDPAMLSWPAGGRPEDGKWAKHWYGAVHRSTGFAGAEGPLPSLPVPLATLAEAAMPAYDTLVAHKLKI